MTTDPQAPAQGGSGDTSRLGVRSIKEASSQRDEELAVIFREMRRASGVTEEQIAGRLATSVSTIEALESGALSELPDWSELKRIVTTYAAQLGLDSRPILRRMQVQLGVADDEVATAEPPRAPVKAAPAAPSNPAAEVPVKPKRASTPTGLPMPPSASPNASSPSPAAPPPRPPAPPKSPEPSAIPVPPNEPKPARRSQAQKAPPPLEVPPQQDAQFVEQPSRPAKQDKGRVRNFAKGALNWSLLIVLVAVLGSGIWYATNNPRKAWNVVDGLPGPIPGLMRGAWELVRPLEKDRSAPAITDPDNRRSNKLP